MTIQKLIADKDTELGQKLIKLSETQEGINQMVAIICDHLGESMKQAYELGMKKQKDTHNPILLRP